MRCPRCNHNVFAETVTYIRYVNERNNYLRSTDNNKPHIAVCDKCKTPYPKELLFGHNKKNELDAWIMYQIAKEAADDISNDNIEGN